jgi:predicted NBD/HSP70 family sugar kinase
MNSAQAAHYNTTRVLRALWLNPGISRVEVAENLGLNRSTITNIINDLMSHGLVKTLALGDSSPLGGRKKVQLGINERYGCVAGLQVHADFIRAVLVNVAGQVLHRHTSAGVVNQASIYGRLRAMYGQLKGRATRLGMPLLGVGCGIPGIADPVQGTIQQSIPLGIGHEEPVGERVKEFISEPFFLDNDANCCCWGELTAEPKPCPNFLFLMGEWRKAPGNRRAPLTSIGMGVVLNEVVHYGRDRSAGEFRSIKWRPGNASQFGLSDDQIARARSDRPLFLAMVRELARNTALLVHVLNLDRVYLGGFFDPADEEVVGIMHDEIRRNWTYPTPPTCQVAFASHAQEAVAYGAAGLILARVFGDPGALAYTGQQSGIAVLFRNQ